LVFCPPTLVYTLRTHRDHVKWAVLDWQAETALAMLGFPASERPNSHRRSRPLFGCSDFTLCGQIRASVAALNAA
jgi:hypothetical protein